MSVDLEDAELMKLVCAGDHSAFTVLVQRHTDKFLALAFRSLDRLGDAEDVVQNSFIKLWQNPQAWQPAKSQFTTWFYRVIINACHDTRRRSEISRKTNLQRIDQSSFTVQSEESTAVDRQNESMQQRCVEKALFALPSSQRDAINLVVYAELPQRQAAQIMGLSVKALESLLFRAKRSMHRTVNLLQEQDNVVEFTSKPNAGKVL